RRVKRSSVGLVQCVRRPSQTEGSLMMPLCAGESRGALQESSEQLPRSVLQCGVQRAKKLRAGLLIPALCKVHVAERHAREGAAGGDVQRFACCHSFGGERARQFVSTLRERQHAGILAPANRERLVKKIPGFFPTAVERGPCLCICGPKVVHI